MSKEQCDRHGRKVLIHRGNACTDLLEEGREMRVFAYWQILSFNSILVERFGTTAVPTRVFSGMAFDYMAC
jgi:hypothetical protein